MSTLLSNPLLRMLLAVLAGFAVACDSSGGDDRRGPELPPISPATVTPLQPHGDWGWDALLLENGIVNLTAVPAIGGRVMEFSLGGHESIWRNEAQLGTTPTPNPSAWPNHGGYKNWPAPQAEWNWPPPPTLDYGAYDAEILFSNLDSASIALGSPVEQFRTPGLRFEREITLYAGSSRVRVAQTIVNEGTATARWSVWDITQHRVTANGDQTRVYVPINPESNYGAEGVRTDGPSAAWSGLVSEDVFEVRFRPDNRKLFADTRRGWVCYVDAGAGYAFAKSFPVMHEAPYPDLGADVEVYVSREGYVEVEVLSPLVDLDPAGGRYTFTEDWWAARSEGAVLDLGPVGLVNQRLSSDGDRFTGRYGVFYVGRGYVVLRDAAGAEVGRSDAFVATPIEHLRVDVRVPVPAQATRAEIVLEDGDGRALGVLDTADL